MAFCTKCGTQSAEGEKFCSNCGAPLDAGAPAAGAPTAAAPAAAAPASDPSGALPKAPQVDPTQTTATPPGTIPGLAPYGKRIGGYLIDGIILFVVVIFLSFGSGNYGGNLIGLAGGFLYAFILIAVWQGHTVGMKALKVRAVNLDGQTSVEWGTSAIRSAIHAVLWITFIGGILDLLWPLWDEKNQTLHDKVAKTIVLDETVNPGAVN